MQRRKVRHADGEKFGSIVRQLREQRGLTQEELGNLAGISATYVGFVERGDSVPTLTIILQIAAALGVRAAELLRDF